MSDNPSEDAAAVTPADDESTAGNAMEESNEATAKEQTTPMEEDAEEEVQSKDKDDKESAASEKGDDDGGGSLVMDESSRQSAASSSHAASEPTAASDEDAATPRGSVDRMRTQPIDREIEAAPLGDEADYEIDDAADDSLVITGDSAGRGSGRAASKGSGYYRRLADEGVDDDAGSWQKTPTSSGKKASRAHQTYRPVKNAGPKGEIDPLWLVPFDYGWMRELVVRATTAERRLADTYYRAPSGRKLRSMVEIERYLTENSIDLTSANFTFRKEPIYKEPFETVRAAKPGSGSFGRGKDTTPTGSTPKPKVKMLVSSSGKRGRGRPSKEASRGSATSSPLRPGTPATGGGASGDAAESPIVFKTSQPVVLSGGDTPSSSPAPPREVRAVARKHTGKRSAHHSMPAPDAKRARTIAEAVTAAQAEDTGERRLCGLTCPARGGTPPSLHCEVCMCLFHPQCVGWDPHRRAGFVCKGCRAVESKLQQGVVAVAPAPPPPVVPMSSGVGRTIMTAAPAPRVITPISDPIPNAATPRLYSAQDGSGLLSLADEITTHENNLLRSVHALTTYALSRDTRRVKAESAYLVSTITGELSTIQNKLRALAAERGPVRNGLMVDSETEKEQNDEEERNNGTEMSEKELKEENEVSEIAAVGNEVSEVSSVGNEVSEVSSVGNEVSEVAAVVESLAQVEKSKNDVSKNEEVDKD